MKLNYLPYLVLAYCLIIANNAYASDCTGPRPAQDRPTERITGGIPTLLKYWPGQATLRYHIKDKDQSFYFCGGTLISPKWMLTAAHCILDIYKQQPPYRKKLDAVAGSSMRGRGLVQVHYGTASLAQYQSGMVIQPKRIIPHPKYKTSSKEHDIALIELNGLANIQTTRIAASAKDNPTEPPGAMLMVAGFGNLEEGEPLQLIDRPGTGFAKAGSPALHEALLPLVGMNRCAAKFPGKTIGDGHLCAGYRTGIKDSCQGDSGGPLVAFDNQDCPYQIGIVSWGVGCGQAESYGVYTRISHYTDWIREVTENSPDIFYTKPEHMIDWRSRAYKLGEIDTILAGIAEQLNSLAPTVELRLLSTSGETSELEGLQQGVNYHFELTSPVEGHAVVIVVDDADGTVTQLYPNHIAKLDAANTIPAGAKIILQSDVSTNGFRDSKALKFRATSLANGRLLTMIVPEGFDRKLILGDVLQTASNSQLAAEIGFNYLYDLADQIRSFNSVNHSSASFGYSVHPFTVQ